MPHLQLKLQMSSLVISKCDGPMNKFCIYFQNITFCYCSRDKNNKPTFEKFDKVLVYHHKLVKYIWTYLSTENFVHLIGFRFASCPSAPLY